VGPDVGRPDRGLPSRLTTVARQRSPSPTSWRGPRFRRTNDGRTGVAEPRSGGCGDRISMTRRLSGPRFCLGGGEGADLVLKNATNSGLPVRLGGPKPQACPAGARSPRVPGDLALPPGPGPPAAFGPGTVSAAPVARGAFFGRKQVRCRRLQRWCPVCPKKPGDRRFPRLRGPDPVGRKRLPKNLQISHVPLGTGAGEWSPVGPWVFGR